MKLIEVGSNSYEVVEDGKCLFAGLKGDCESFLDGNPPKEEVKEIVSKPKKRGRKPKAVVEGGDG